MELDQDYSNFKQESINFLEVRDFGKLLGAPFTFFKQEFKLLSKALLLYASPFLAFSMIGLGIFMKQVFENVTRDTNFVVSLFLYIGLFIVFLMISFSMANVVINNYVSLYVKKGKGNFNLDDIWTEVKGNFFKLFIEQVITGFIILIGLLFLYIPGIYLQIALSFVFISTVHEKLSIGQGLSRSFQLIKGEWWITFAVTMVLGMILGFVSYIFILPPYIIGIFAAINNTFNPVIITIMVIFVALYLVFYLFVYSLQQLLVIFQYFSLVEKKESPGLASRINSINKDSNTFKFKDENKTEDTIKTGENFIDENYNDRFKPKY